MSREKRITAHQAFQSLHQFYDGLESSSLAALEKALYEALGVGTKRFERVKAVYLRELKAEAQKLSQGFKRDMNRRLR